MAIDPSTGKTRRGKRAGADRARLRDIHSSLDGRPAGTHSNHAHSMKGSSATARFADDAKYFEAALIEERPETHIVPRKSVTVAQYLKIFPQKFETETMQGRQLDHASGKMVTVTYERLKYKSDRTLLRRGNAFDKIGTFKRQGEIIDGLNRRKFIETRNEDAVRIVDEVIENALPDDADDFQPAK